MQLIPIAISAATTAGSFLTSSAGVTSMIAAGTALDLYGGIQQGNAEAAAARYQQRVAKNQAALAEQNAQQELLRSQIAQQRGDFSALQEISEIISDQAGTGLSGLSGSKFALVRSLSDMARLDAANVRNEGNVTATQLRQQKVGFRQEANFYGSAASNAKRGIGLNIMRSFLGGAQAYNRARVTGLIT